MLTVSQGWVFGLIQLRCFAQSILKLQTFHHDLFLSCSVYNVEILAKLSDRKKIFYCKQPCIYDFQRVN